MAAMDLLDERRSSRRFRVALRAAGQLDDPVLSGMVCLRMSEAALAVKRSGEALELANAGGRLVGTADPALRATLWLAAARAHEAAGSTVEALHVLDAGEELVGAKRLPPSPWTRVDAARFAGGRGMVEAALGRWVRAERALRAGIAAYPPGNGLRGVLLAHLAGVRFGRGDPEQAAALAMEALPVLVRLGSPSRLATLERLRPWLSRYERCPAVAELTGRLRPVRPAIAAAAGAADQPCPSRSP